MQFARNIGEIRLLSNVPALKLLMTTGFEGLDGLTFNPDHLPLEPRSWSDLRLKPDRRGVMRAFLINSFPIIDIAYHVLVAFSSPPPPVERGSGLLLFPDIFSQSDAAETIRMLGTASSFDTMYKAVAYQLPRSTI